MSSRNDLPTIPATEKDTFKISAVIRAVIERLNTIPFHINNNSASVPAGLGGSGTLLQVSGASGSNAAISVNAYGAGTAATIRFTRALGTPDAPSQLTNGATIGIFGALGYGSTGYAGGNRARVVMGTSQLWTDSAQGTFISFETTENGSTSMTEKVRISNDGALQMGGTNNVVTSTRHPQLRTYTVATVPSAATAAQLIYVSDETGGATVAFSDGTNWRRVQDRAVVS